MSLNFTNQSRSYDATRQAVRFWGYDASREVSFFITADALSRLQPSAPKTDLALLSSFDNHRATIQVAAAKVYARGRKGSYELGPGDFR
jgi:hypothetical protein